MGEEVRVCFLKGFDGTDKLQVNQLTRTNSPLPKYTGCTSDFEKQMTGRRRARGRLSQLKRSAGLLGEGANFNLNQLLPQETEPGDQDLIE